jgi:leucyl-tRNA synthetase
MKYNPSIIEKKWQKKWADKKVFKANIDNNKPKY